MSSSFILHGGVGVGTYLGTQLCFNVFCFFFTFKAAVCALRGHGCSCCKRLSLRDITTFRKACSSTSRAGWYLWKYFVFYQYLCNFWANPHQIKTVLKSNVFSVSIYDLRRNYFCIKVSKTGDKIETCVYLIELFWHHPSNWNRVK